MEALHLEKLHKQWGAELKEVSGKQVVRHYGDPRGEYDALVGSAGLLDLSYRSRLCLTGADRQSFLNGQLTNVVPAPEEQRGAYAVLTDNKGRIQSDVNYYSLAEEILLDFEPGLVERVKGRLERYIIAEDCEVVDVASMYGLLSVQGPQARNAIKRLDWSLEIPEEPLTYSGAQDPTYGEVYLMNHPRLGSDGFDCFVPADSLQALAEKCYDAVGSVGGRPSGYDALETARIEVGIPRFGLDMDESNLAPEPGIAPRAISYTKGCYTGQEVIARIRTYGQVKKSLCGLILPENLEALPERGEKLYDTAEKSIGYITSSVRSPKLNRPIALGYVRKEHLTPGTEAVYQQGGSKIKAQVTELPFTAP